MSEQPFVPENFREKTPNALEPKSGFVSPAEQEEISFERRVSEFLNSENFLNFIREFPDKERGSKIGMILEYFTIHPDGFELNEFLKVLAEKRGIRDISEVSEQIVNSIMRKLGINDPNHPDSANKIFEYFSSNFFDQGYFFHGFNGAFLKNIQTEGLALHSRRWDWQELKTIIEIGKRVGVPMLLGWGGINSEGKISLAGTAGNVYHYACSSPEWFAQFVSEGFHIPNEKKKKEAYYRRDYATARQNIADVCQELMSRREEDIKAKKAHPNLTAQEKQTLTDFFEKYWKIFAGADSRPQCCLVAKSALEWGGRTYTDFDDYRTGAFNAKINEQPTIQNAVKNILGMQGFSVDIQIKRNVPSRDIKIVNLPDYNKVFPE